MGNGAKSSHFCLNDDKKSKSRFNLLEAVCIIIIIGKQPCGSKLQVVQALSCFPDHQLGPDVHWQQNHANACCDVYISLSCCDFLISLSIIYHPCSTYACSSTCSSTCSNIHAAAHAAVHATAHAAAHAAAACSMQASSVGGHDPRTAAKAQPYHHLPNSTMHAINIQIGIELHESCF